MNLHDFEPQREPFEYLCSECGMGQIAVYHTGSRFQAVRYGDGYKIIDRAQSQEQSQIATTSSQKNATLIIDALNAHAATPTTEAQGDVGNMVCTWTKYQKVDEFGFDHYATTCGRDTGNSGEFAPAWMYCPYCGKTLVTREN